MVPRAYRRNELGGDAYGMLMGCSRLLKTLEGFHRLLKAVDCSLIQVVRCSWKRFRAILRSVNY